VERGKKVYANKDGAQLFEEQSECPGGSRLEGKNDTRKGIGGKSTEAGFLFLSLFSFFLFF
jgi:hypothetical protein